MNLKVETRILIIICFLQLTTKQQAACFWFTDTSLLLPPNGIPYVVAQDSDLDRLALATKNANAAVKLKQPEVVDLSSNEIPKGSRVDYSSNWPLAAGHQTLELCQCNKDWFQNQTNSWLNKWLKSDFVLNQMKLLMLSNSTGASGNNKPAASSIAPKRDAKSGNGNDSGGGQGNNFGNHWRGGNNGANRSSDNNNNNNGSPQVNRNKKNIKQQFNENGQKVQLKLVQGAPGSKGEPGAKGDRGPSGLISVQDRKSLFELAMTGPLDDSIKLVFVESEQMLVLKTNKGYRPIQLLSPLKDFSRKITSKFNLLPSPSTNPLFASTMERKFSVKGRKDNASDDLDDLDDASDGDDAEDDDDDDDDEDGDDDEEADDDNLIEDDPIDIPGGPQKRQRGAVAGRSGLSMPRTVFAEPEPSATTTTANPTADIKNDRNGMKFRIAALNEPYSGNIHGIRGADFECKRNAAKANIKGSFRALLASSYQNLNEIVRYNRNKYPVVNLKGEILANSWHDLFKQPARVPNPLSRVYSFDGRHVANDPKWPNKMVWHGSNNKYGFRANLANNCDSWHSDSLNKFGFATPIQSNQSKFNLRGQQHHNKKRHLSDANLANSTAFEMTEKYPCRMPMIVLCIETIGQQIDFNLPTINSNNEFENNNL